MDNIYINYKITKNVDLIKDFFKKNKEFNFNEYKKLNINLKDFNDVELINHYYSYGKKKNLLASIKDFYNLYPDFDILFYKLIYENLNFNNDIDFLTHYHNIGHIENNLYSLDDFKKKYEVNFLFLKNFYTIFNDKNFFEIGKIIINNNNNNNNNNYIFSDEKFMIKFPDFNIKIYKLFNQKIYFNNDIKYKSYWYHYGKNEKQISSVNDFIKYYENFDLSLYKCVYNISHNLTESDLIYFYNNKDTLIYSLDKLVNYLDDFNFNFFLNYYPKLRNYDHAKIIEYYISNKIINIYSEKFFYLKYPDFNIDEYKRLNNINNNNNNNILIEYFLSNKENLIISINDFYKKYPEINLSLYKNVINIKNNIIFNDDKEYIYYFYNNDKNRDNLNISNSDFYKSYPDFNLNIYKYFNKEDIKYLDNKSILYYFKFNNKIDTIYSFKSFYNKFKNFNINIYKLFNNLENYNEEELIIHFQIIGIHFKLVYNESMFADLDFNVDIYKELNKDLAKLNNTELIIHWYKYGKSQNRIYSKETFYKKYPNMNNLNSENKIIYWMNIGIYKDIQRINEKIIGRDVVNNIYEVLIDLSNQYPKNKLEKGVSLIIRAKNEEHNIKHCIESVVDLVDEIIFIDNNSTDKTYDIMEEYCKKYDIIKLYKYNIDVSKVGIEHKKSLDTNNKNTLGTFYNWCLSKATKYNVFKWDADFICIRNNFVQLVNKYNLRTRDDKFAIWFTGITLFENNKKFYLNYNSFYDEYRIFSYKNNFCWYDGNTCEYTDPYLNTVPSEKKYKFIHPLFYEVKRTSLDEFEERSSMIDSRDVKDFYILNNLRENKKLDLIEIKNDLINLNKKIILFTPSLSLGGGNQFILNIYKLYKSFGFIVIIVPMKNDNIGSNKYNIIIEEDILNIKNFNVEFIKKFNPQFILFNSTIHFHLEDIILLSSITKIFFITHSDVAFSNSFIEKYHQYFAKIITVNNYTITKISKKLNIPLSKFLKIINYSEIKNKIEINPKNKKFGIISRFSEDKNIPMLILALKDVFKKYNNYICYFIGTHNSYYDDYLIDLCKSNNLDKNICFEGYKDDVLKYYEIFDFIVLPSVSEGCSYNIIEAMTLGIPVVVSDVGGNHELIKNKENGIIYKYTEIRNYEAHNLYVTSYNEHLSNIGYFVNNSTFKELYKSSNNFNKTEVIIPHFVECLNLNCNKTCVYCKNIIKQQNIFNINLENIKNSIIDMIEFNNDTIKNMRLNNINFINKNFNQYIYINQILELAK